MVFPDLFVLSSSAPTDGGDNVQYVKIFLKEKGKDTYRTFLIWSDKGNGYLDPEPALELRELDEEVISTLLTYGCILWEDFTVHNGAELAELKIGDYTVKCPVRTRLDNGVYSIDVTKITLIGRISKSMFPDMFICAHMCNDICCSFNGSYAKIVKRSEDGSHYKSYLWWTKEKGGETLYNEMRKSEMYNLTEADIVQQIRKGLCVYEDFIVDSGAKLSELDVDGLIVRAPLMDFDMLGCEPVHVIDGTKITPIKKIEIDCD